MAEIDTKSVNPENSEEKVDGDSITQLPDEMPLLPLRDIVIFPYMVVPILVIRETSVGALQAALMNDRYIFLVLQRNPEVDAPETADLHGVGVIGRALQVLKLPNGTAKVLVEGVSRAMLTGMERAEDHFRAKVSRFSLEPEPDQRFKALVRSLSNSFASYVKLSKTIPDEVLMNMPPPEEPQRLTDSISAHLFIKQEKKQAILEASSMSEQISILLSTLAEEIEIMELSIPLTGKSRSVSRNHRRIIISTSNSVSSRKNWARMRTRTARSANSKSASESRGCRKKPPTRRLKNSASSRKCM